MGRVFLPWLRALPIVSLAMLLLVGCSGGGNSVAEITGSGSRQGDIEAFGSIFIAGERYDSSVAEITINGNPATEAQLQVGMKAELSLRPYNSMHRIIDRLAVNSRLVGQVDHVDLSQRRIYILGQEVRIDDRTVLSFAGPAAFEEGQLVSVFGSEVADGVLLAGRIEANSSAMAAKERLLGLVSSVSGSELIIGNLTVDISAVSNGPVVQPGDRVMASGLRNRAVNPNRLAADELRIVPVQAFEPGESVLLVGVISEFDQQSSGSLADFTMDGIGIHHIEGTDTVVGGSRSGAQNGSRVVVEGFATDESRLVRGQVITFIPDVEAEVETLVTAVDAVAGTLTVFGDIEVELGVQSQFIAAPNSERRAYSLTDIMVGDRIELRLARVDLFGSRNQLLSEADLEIARVSAQNSVAANELIVAPLEAANEASRQVVLLGQTVDITDATQFGSDLDEAEFFATAKVGDVVEVELNNSNGQLTALEVSIDGGELDHDSELEFQSGDGLSEAN